MMRRAVVAGIAAIVAGCSSNQTGPIHILRIKDAYTPYKGFILDRDASGHIVFETCAGNILPLQIGDLAYEGDFPGIECASLSRRIERGDGPPPVTGGPPKQAEQPAVSIP